MLCLGCGRPGGVSRTAPGWMQSVGGKGTNLFDRIPGDSLIYRVSALRYSALSGEWRFGVSSTKIPRTPSLVVS